MHQDQFCKRDFTTNYHRYKSISSVFLFLISKSRKLLHKMNEKTELTQLDLTQHSFKELISGHSIKTTEWL